MATKSWDTMEGAEVVIDSAPHVSSCSTHGTRPGVRCPDCGHVCCPDCWALTGGCCERSNHERKAVR